jgi:Fic-DOC domain mobile mystery protein B
MTEPFHADDDATPLTQEARNGLIPTHITLRRELNELEQQNIAKAYRWAFSRKRNVLSEAYVRSLHGRMLKDVWRWAGKYRTSEVNLGIEPYRIQPELRQTIDDARYQIEHHSYPPDEIAVRFHHRLVSVHPFLNGNGRWARLAADLLIVQLGGKPFSWGSANLQEEGEARRAYMDALHAADDHDLAALIGFARK